MRRTFGRTGGVYLPADYGQKSAVASRWSWSASLLDPSFCRTTGAHAGALGCLSSVHGCSFQPRPAQGAIQDDPRGAWSRHKLHRAPEQDQASQDGTKTANTSPSQTEKMAELCLCFTCISLPAEGWKDFFKPLVRLRINSSLDITEK